MSVRTHRQLRRALVAGVTATAVVASIVVIDGAPGAGAASKPLAQSVGRFLDGSVGGKPIQQLADVHDARAVNPGTTSAQNPLDATLLGQLDLPLSGALQLPGGGVFTLGAVNQVAQAKSDGYSYGASGAVSNSGGVSLGGSSGFPANATIDLSADALGSVGIPTLPGLPALPDAAALGGVQATIGAVSGLAQTKAGGDTVTPQYQIAGLTLKIGSPALGALLSQLSKGKAALDDLIQQVESALTLLGKVPGIGKALQNCSLTSTSLPNKIVLDSGAIVIDPLHASLTIDLGKLLKKAHLDLNDLPANTDLMAWLLGNLGTILSQGLEGVIDGIVTPLKDLGDKCLALLPANIKKLLDTLFGTLTDGQAQLESAVNKIAAALASAGAPGLKALTDNLAKVAAIGVNVESGPGKAADNPTYKFSSKLDATPDQATPVVENQTLVRALEIDVLGGQLAVLALGNAAAGPSSALAPPTSSTPAPSPTTTIPATAIPTGVPAGQAETGGTPTLPIVLLLLGLLMAAGGAATWRLRGGKHTG